MSSNSCARIFATAPIVSAFRGRDAPDPARGASGRDPSSVATALTSPLQIAELVLADLDLVAVLEAVRLDPPPVHVGPVERAEVVDVVAVLAPHDERVVARHGDVVEEHRRIGGPADAHPVLVDREALPRAPSPGANHERRPDAVNLLLQIDRLVLAGLVDAVAHRRGLLLPG